MSLRRQRRPGAPWRTARALSLVSLVAVLCGCVPASEVPQPPSAGQLRSLISESSGTGSDGYDRLGVDIVRFIPASEWAQVMTTCVRERGITGVDFREAHDPYWSSRSDQGVVALSKAMNACELEYPLASQKRFLLTDEQLDYEFHYLRGPFTQCIAQAGGAYTPPRSLSRFIADARNFTASDPFASMKKPRSGLSVGTLSHICPSLAPGL